ncbi:MAG: glutathione S-transferase family protein [Verrucomicrobia bacterium]|nr:glutathione S-transferase family protein [Verrucomicrobiota bacterium]
MEVTVYEMEHSPFCIPVTQVLTALGIGFERVAVPNWDRSIVIEVTGGSYYQVPVLKHGDKVIAESSPDSQDIPHYIDQTFAGGRLFPEANSGLQEIVIAYIENDIESVTFKAVDSFYIDSLENPVARMMTIRHKERKFGPGCVAAWQRSRDELRGAAEALLMRFETTLRHSPFVLGQTPCYVDFSLFGVLANYQYRGYNTLPDAFSGIRNWYRSLEQFRFDDC